MIMAPAEFHCLDLSPVLSSFHYHYARLIEILDGIEMIEHLLTSPDILDRNVRSTVEVNALEGIGVSKAPRGTLLHLYEVNEEGMVEWANMIIASGNNNLALRLKNRFLTEREPETIVQAPLCAARSICRCG